MVRRDASQVTDVRSSGKSFIRQGVRLLPRLGLHCAERIPPIGQLRSDQIPMFRTADISTVYLVYDLRGPGSFTCRFHLSVRSIPGQLNPYKESYVTKMV